MKKIILSLVLYLSIFGFVSAGVSGSDLNNNGIEDGMEEEVFVDHDATLPAGEYNFKNLVIASSSRLTLGRDENLPDPFKGVKINAVNLKVLEGSSISSDGGIMYGTNYGPGVSPEEFYYIGASYGGLAYNSKVNNTYGSAMKPIDLGSDGYFKGGGAIRLSVSDTLLNNGRVSAVGGSSASGGSIYVTTKNLSGNGLFSANGGSLFASGYYKSPGGGGRIAIYYEANSFIGKAEAKGGCGSYSWPIVSCGESGTVGFFDTVNNNLFTDSFWRFQINDNPFNLNNIYVKNAGVATEEGVNVNAKELLLDQNSSMVFSKNQVLNISKIIIDHNSTLTFSGLETLTTDFLSLNNSSIVTVLPENKLYLKIPTITVSSDSAITVEGKGYGANTGLGATTADMYRVGASYGGVGYLNTPESVYGSDLEPVDFGSGGSGYFPRGGGAIKIESDDLINDGLISANGLNTSSGGSIYVTTKNLSGSGSFTANGGSSYCPNICMGPGGGGRIAIYYGNNTFSGTATASGWSGYGGSSEDGTVVVKETESGASNVLFIPGLEASRLYMERENGTEDQLWEPNSPSDVSDLYLDSNGNSINDVYTKDVIGETNILPIRKTIIYKSLVQKLNDLVVTTSLNKIARWEAYPYDWRQSVDDIVNNGTRHFDGKLSLTAVLQTLVETSSNDKVTIIAHSNGGLVAKVLLKKLQEDKLAGRNDLIDHIDNLVLVASPQVGTPEGLFAILHGYDQKLPGKLMSESQARQLALNMPGAYGLLPSLKYFEQNGVEDIARFTPTANQSYLYKYGDAINTYLEQRDFVLGAEGRGQIIPDNLIWPALGNSTLLIQSEGLHSTMDNFIIPQSIKVINIAGWGKETIAGMTYMGDDLEPIYTYNGDKTVVSQSALYGQGDKYWLDLSNSRLEHKNITEDPNLLTFIGNIITDSPNPTDKIYQIRPNINKTRLHLSVHSPITIGMYDKGGNFTGKICDIEDNCYIQEDIPGSTYNEFGEGKYITLGNEEYLQKVVMKGTGTGTFTFKFEKITSEGEVGAEFFKDVPVTNQTEAELTIDTISGEPKLDLDVNGDKVVDFVLGSNEEFNPVVFLEILKKTVEFFDTNIGQRQKLSNRINDIIKFIEKGEINKAKLKSEIFTKSLEHQSFVVGNGIGHKLNKVEIDQMLEMINKLLDILK